MRYPANGPVTSKFGWRIHPVTGTRKHHDGTDQGWGNGGGTKIYAPMNATVDSYSKVMGHGNRLVLRGRYGDSTLVVGLSHLAGSLVTRGQTVTEGEHIATMGNTGTSTGTHVHTEARLNGALIDFESLLTGTASGDSTPIGFLMALTDAQQAELFNGVSSIYAAIFGANGELPSLPNATNLPTAIETIRAAVGEIQAYSYYGGEKVSGTIGDPGSVFGRVITLQAQVTGLTEAIKALASGQGIDPSAIEEAARKGAEKALEGIQLAVIKE